ncbi:MAG: hypothetical protein ACTHMI_07245 [Mucilaginibacter sp.]|uniref:hypothetical protein n=1 Tax=Mucilaginibacter sp. L3T2-6 TaxID=3062491 RepID=UPI002676610C|nr:hypothetical protein [Mucilaginibacter sp. L3T2-6]MDO3640659.1 hypothetical protein [Mucilaginibacter sp. L3T2-6]MDV6213002.1 hypothetical protein [Mucilaginibacter sp. L3T2-6]
MSQQKPLIRRTFLQERYEILIKRQREGKATFNELTELDDIVNRDPAIREIVLIENHFIPGADDNNHIDTDPTNEVMKQPQRRTVFTWLKDLFERIFMLPVTEADGKIAAYL